jgi:two-component system response regulator
MEKMILLVEDNPDDVELTLRAFRKNNMLNPIKVARDGVEALEILGLGDKPSTKPDLPAVILLDLKLPKLDGMEVLRRIRANECTRLLPVVILTSSREDEDLSNGYRLGANSYIRKPVDFGRFLTAVQQLGMYWLLLNEPPPPNGC